MISDCNSGKWRPIFKLLSLADFQGNYLCIYDGHFRLTFTVLPHYLVVYRLTVGRDCKHHVVFLCSDTPSNLAWQDVELWWAYICANKLPCSTYQVYWCGNFRIMQLHHFIALAAAAAEAAAHSAHNKPTLYQPSFKSPSSVYFWQNNSTKYDYCIQSEENTKWILDSALLITFNTKTMPYRFWVEADDAGRLHQRPLYQSAISFATYARQLVMQQCVLTLTSNNMLVSMASAQFFSKMCICLTPENSISSIMTDIHSLSLYS